jgi:hypothetical protein
MSGFYLLRATGSNPPLAHYRSKAFASTCWFDASSRSWACESQRLKPAQPMRLVPFMERRLGESQEARFQRVERDIAERLRPVCSHMPESDFAELVKHVAAVNIKYAARRASDMFSGLEDLPPARVGLPPPEELE